MTVPIPNYHHNSLVTRRSIFIGAAASMLCAPAIVRVASLMEVRRLPFPIGPQSAGFVERLYLHALESGLQTALRAGRTSIDICSQTIAVEIAGRQVAFAQAHGFLPPYICIYRSS